MRGPRTPCRSAGAALSLLIGLAAPATAQTAANVAVVINENNPESVRVGEHYITRRSIPAANVVRIRVPAGETIDRSSYTTGIEVPISRAFMAAGLHDRILYIVLTRGVPLRITGTAGQRGTSASVDSELTLLYRRMTGRPAPAAGTIDNPYFSEAPGKAALPFDRKAHDVYLVTRLDGLSADDVVQLIDRGIAAEAAGAIVFDQRGDPRAAMGDRWMREAADALGTSDPTRQVVVEDTLRAASITTSTMGLFAWGSADPAYREGPLTVPFTPGSIAATIGSTDAASFQVSDRGPRPLAGELVRAGATGVGANTAEPYLASTLRPQVLFPAYLGGLPLAEAFYRALPHLSWQSVIIGDPLVRPFGTSRPLTELEAPPDATTGLSPIFAARRLEALAADIPRVGPDELRLVIASEVHQARGNDAAAIDTLTKAVDGAGDSVLLQLRLATRLDETGKHEEAITRYRRVLALEPRNTLALNNLAYRLGSDGANLPEALELARRAYTLAPGEGTIADTLGWLEHLAGNRQEAVRLLRQAVQRVPGHAEIRLHAAIVLAEAGATAEARKHLEAALKLDPAFADREDVRELTEQLRGRQ
jgi:uncharacterized protein (TIGR03790 family)